MLHDRDQNIADSEIWKQLCDGDKSALDRLFRRYYSHLFNYGIKIISSEEVVKDAIQELFIGIWNRCKGLNTPDSVQAYLLVSLRRILLLNKKRQIARYERNKIYLDEDFSVSYTIEEIIINQEFLKGRKKIILEAVNHMTGKEKEALYLKYYHGLTNSEIAEVMGIKRQSVKNNIYRALKTLKELVFITTT